MGRKTEANRLKFKKKVDNKKKNENSKKEASKQKKQLIILKFNEAKNE